ncbi:Rho GTPase activation protein [Xylaria bambusicola]|uniref:Rho GTPase activation protein n=1 Tax=Xylaria bambusicola TaxID=326684 RepID=UPI0020083078|nr:Rho GTPase activation protein [Xylaria bambusicola]KAI0521435.1 Rho GTPase activation protein [Xylaria bambusicola]
MVDLSITADCVALGGKIIQLLSALTSFVRNVREARSDIDAVSRELHSLQTVLELLEEDADLFPPELVERTAIVVNQCSSILDKVNASIAILNDPARSKQQKRTQWLDSGVPEISGFRTTLEAHRVTLGLALDLIGVTTTRDLTSDATNGKNAAIQRYQIDDDVLTDVSTILIQMGQICVRLPGEFEKSPSRFSLHEYMSCLKGYAEGIIRRKEMELVTGPKLERHAKQTSRETQPGAFIGESQQFGAYVGDAPDSAIDMDDEEPTSWKSVGLPEKRIDEETSPTDDTFDSSLDVPTRAPTPPPKDIKRLEAARRKMASPFEKFEDDEPDSPTNPYGVFTEISSGGQQPAPSVASSKGRGFKRFFPSFKSSPSENKPTDIRPPTQSTSSAASTAPAEIRPVTPIVKASLVRRGSRRLSVSVKKLPLWNMEQLEEVEGGPETRAVFGVSLQKSMQVAKGTSKTHHGDKGGSSRRDFPLCMQKCCFFLKHHAVATPDIFAEPGDIFNVAKLKEVFSKGPTYGQDVSFENYTVYDVADLALLYLSQLPRPLVPESLARRWISLSRQATLSGSHATRLDQCIDFWEEALSGLRGPSRSLFKLLLNLWADVAQAEEQNDMTAERLADVVLKPLMHVSSGQYRTDYMLSLAFLIRRRAEYTALLADNQSAIKRISRAAW